MPDPSETVIEIEASLQDLNGNGRSTRVDERPSANVEARTIERAGSSFASPSSFQLAQAKDDSIGTKSEWTKRNILKEPTVAPFATHEEYIVRMQEDIRTGRAENRWFFEPKGGDGFSCAGSKSKFARPVPIGVGQDKCSYFSIDAERDTYFTKAAARDQGNVFVRVLFNQQIQIAKNSNNLIETITLGKVKAIPNIELCYIDFYKTSFPEDSYDCTTFTTPLPRKFINAGSFSEDGQFKSRSIYRFALSPSGSNLVAVSREGLAFIIDWWELGLSASNEQATYPCLGMESHASITFKMPNIVTSLDMAVSWNGSQIAVFSTEEKPLNPVLLYGPAPLEGPIRTADKRSNPPIELQELTRHKNCKGLEKFCGPAKFTSAVSKMWDDSTERFIACDRSVVSIYSTGEEWQCLHSIRMTNSPRIYGASFTVAATAPIFLWEDSPLQLSLWDTYTGKLLRLISTQKSISHHQISSDGQTIAVFTEDGVYFFSTQSGNLLHPFALRNVEPTGYFSGNGGFLYQDTAQRTNHSARYVFTNLSSLTQLKECKLETLITQDSLVFQQIQNEASPESTVTAIKHGSVFQLSYLDDILDSANGPLDSSCSIECDHRQRQLQPIHDSTIFTILGEEYPLAAFKQTSMPPPSIFFCKSLYGNKYFSVDAYHYFSLEKQNQLVSLCLKESVLSLFIWRLPAQADHAIELLLALSLDNISGPVTLQSCQHERKISVVHSKGSIPISLDRAHRQQPKEFFRAIDTVAQAFYNCQLYGKDNMANVYLRYLGSIINSYPVPNDVSVSAMSRLCERWSVRRAGCIVPIFRYILTRDGEHSWRPFPQYSKGSNPIGQLLEYSRMGATVVDLIRALVDYCTSRAQETQDITFVLFLCECLDDLYTQFPDIALQVTRSFAYLKSPDIDAIACYYKVAVPPSISSLWNRERVLLGQCRNPVLQLVDRPQVLDQIEPPSNEVYFVTPFSLLWAFYPDKNDRFLEYSRREPQVKTTRLGTLLSLALFHVNPFNHVYIRSRPHDLNVLDNPAIEALVQYKWNTIGFRIWLTRFAAQVVNYALIIAAAMLQVYNPMKDPLYWIFIVIIILSVLFLWMEFLQWRESRYCLQSKPSPTIKERLLKIPAGIKSLMRRKESRQENMNFLQDNVVITGIPERKLPSYFSTYNILDLLMYLTPIATSIHQLLNISENEPNRDSWGLSFCLVLVFLHALSELRVIESVCKYVTIVFEILRQIRVFLGVFALGVIMYSLAILHVILGNKNPDNNPQTEFPNDFFGALSTGFFILGGRYEPIQDDLFSDNQYGSWQLQLLLLTYFFFAVIVMLNVLIAIVNEAYINGDISWRQVWFENRLSIVEQAENLSFHIPGFRESNDWFPDKIYYGATSYQVKQYWKRINVKDEEVILDWAEQEPGTTVEESTKSSPDSSKSLDLWELEQRVIAKMGHIEQLVQGQQIVSGQMSKAPGQKSDVSELRGDMTNLEDKLSGLKSELTDLKGEITDVKNDIRTVLAVLLALQNTQRQ
ncbi:hypothetical protein BGW38_005210 [Lunasporangiospora selenospora]|uniref:Ion transport domain-containing protein n=1 Tax=Lunasporangiospora selenospora TaxID=979761 RepID=A0A9P6G2Q5_9FUNG|nr:hypothetical protein BGW38_005210 [Lunasporangiospora selenospora]